MQVKFSPGNSKMGAIPSVSLPSVLTCRNDCGCVQKCYARRLENFRPSVRAAYQQNYDLLIDDPDLYWREVEGQIMLSRFFRFHVSGDIPNLSYLLRMIDTARRNPHCQILCFTKRNAFVNSALQDGYSIPDNLHILFSGWKDLPMDNPYRMPEAHVLYKDGTTTARQDASVCGGNCAECARTGEGCWSLKTGEQVMFHEH